MKRQFVNETDTLSRQDGAERKLGINKFLYQLNSVNSGFNRSREINFYG